jgi:hypothetical protein
MMMFSRSEEIGVACAHGTGRDADAYYAAAKRGAGVGKQLQDRTGDSHRIEIFLKR